MGGAEISLIPSSNSSSVFPIISHLLCTKYLLNICKFWDLLNTNNKQHQPRKTKDHVLTRGWHWPFTELMNFQWISNPWQVYTISWPRSCIRWRQTTWTMHGRWTHLSVPGVTVYCCTMQTIQLTFVLSTRNRMLLIILEECTFTILHRAR